MNDYATAPDGRSTWMAPSGEPAGLPPIVATGPGHKVGWLTAARTGDGSAS